jgi:hypothetical protein
MPPDPSPTPMRPRPRRLPIAVAVLVGVLLFVPVVALMLVSTFAKHGPQLWGFPFFYWYQLMWVFIAAAVTWAAYLIVTRARRNDRNGR